MKITCPLKDGIAPDPVVPTIREAWANNFGQHSHPYQYDKFDLEAELHQRTQYNTPYLKRTNHNAVLLFNSEEELNTWANNCRLTDPQSIADQEMWKTAHGITFTYEYYLLSPTTGPDPVL
jgi:hypothetical protein